MDLPRADLMLIRCAVSCNRTADCSVEHPCPVCSDIMRGPLTTELARLAKLVADGDPEAGDLLTRIAEIEYQLTTFPEDTR